MTRLAFLAVALVAAACGTSPAKIPLDRFLAGDLGTVIAAMEQEAVEGDAENLALVRNVEGQCRLLQGDAAGARQNLEEAARIMGNWSTSGGEATAAIVGSESSKTYKGDPYEKAMNAFYRSICYVWLGEPDNARAALKRGILADAEVGDEKYQEDNALLFWLAGRTSILMGARDADEFFQDAREAHAFAVEHGARGLGGERLLEQPAAGNLVLLFECGMGPEKFADGAQEELARFRPRPHPAARARAALDGQPLGEAVILCDVDYQARTLGGTEMEGIRKGKAVLKTVTTTAGAVLLADSTRDPNSDRAQTKAIVGGALLLFGLLTSSAADTRHWPTLPSTVQVLTATVPAGEHALDVEFLAPDGTALPHLSQRVSVTIPDRGETWRLFRSLPAAPTPSAPRP